MFGDPFYTLKPYDQVIKLKKDFDISSIDWSEVMCIIVETCSYSQTLQPNTEQFWNKLTQLQKQGVVLILDDIFIGGGKTGSFVGWYRLPVKPDIFTMGKAITAGFFPLSATMYGQRIDEVIPDNFDWEHGFTYNFSQAGILSTLKYIDLLHEEMPFEFHFTLKERAIHIFIEAGYDIVGHFGLIFDVKRKEDRQFFVIPINATDEYFDILKEQLK